MPVAWFVAAHLGVHHTHVDKDDGSPDGYGPRAELEVDARPLPWLSLAPVASFAHYSTANLYDGVTHTDYDYKVNDLGLGLRAWAAPHPRIALGATLWSTWERETTTLQTSPTWLRTNVYEADARVTLAHTHDVDIQALAALAVFERFDGSEHGATWSVALGVEHAL